MYKYLCGTQLVLIWWRNVEARRKLNCFCFIFTGGGGGGDIIGWKIE